MSGIDKARMQHDARRTVANRRTTGASSPEQAIVHHLGVELYKERHRSLVPGHRHRPGGRPCHRRQAFVRTSIADLPEHRGQGRRSYCSCEVAPADGDLSPSLVRRRGDNVVVGPSVDV